MSHFSVLVIGENWEDQLARYSENLDVEPYKDYCDLGSDAWPGSALAKDHPDVDRTDLPLVAKLLSEKWSAPYEADDLGVYKMSTYNPRSKWDWYEVGGRWMGYWPLKPGVEGEVGRPGVMTDAAPSGTADQCRKGAIDFDRKGVEAGAKAGEQWDEYEALLKLHGPALTWAEVLDEEDIDASRQRYWAQPLVNALRAARLPDLDQFLPSREGHVLLAMRSACPTWGLVAEGAWAEKGRMGRFGMSADEKEPEDWNDFWWRIVERAPDDTLFTIVDCHI